MRFSMRRAFSLLLLLSSASSKQNRWTLWNAFLMLFSAVALAVERSTAPAACRSALRSANVFHFGITVSAVLVLGIWGQNNSEFALLRSYA